MSTFEQAIELTDKVGGRTAYEIEALRGLWTALTLLRPDSNIIEVGCEYGRSTSLLAQAAKNYGHKLTLVDPFTDAKSIEGLVRVLRGIGHPFVLCVMTTQEADLIGAFPHTIHLAHIDGDHSRPALELDCKRILPRMPRDGIAVFHDYNHDSLPDVKPVVDEFTKGWEIIGTWHTCHVLRKP